jgi:thiol:disulfide interchange protein
MPRILRALVWVLVALATLMPSHAAFAQSVVEVALVAERAAVRPGEQGVLAVVIDLQPGWHIHTNDPKPPASWPDFVAIPTEVTPTAKTGVKFGPLQWPKPHEVPLDLSGEGAAPYGVFSDRAVVYIPFEVASDAAGDLALSVEVSYQACDDRKCQGPTSSTMPVNLRVLAPGEPAVVPSDASLFKDFDRSAFARMDSGAQAAPKPVGFQLFGGWFTIDPAGALGLAALLLVAAVGGALLNLTPCVLPVIPLKIMGLSKHSEQRGRTLLLGIVMSLGVVAFWAAIGLMMVTITGFKAISQLFQQPLFTLGVGVFILVMGVGMLGLFAVKLPNWVYLIDPKSDTVSGSFLFGIMTAVLSTPCTAPFMGTAAAWAVQQTTAVTLSVFAAIGLGMASPYLLLTLFPHLLARVPRAGPGSELVKQTMGLLMVAVAVFFLGTGLDPLLRLPIDPPIRWFWWVILGISAVAMGWLVYRTIHITLRIGPRTFVSVLGAATVAALAIIVARVTDRGPIRWQGYTPERLQAALDKGQVAVIDFTAEWCLNCKLLENTVLHRPDVAGALNGSGVVALRADLTGSNPPAQKKLDELRWIGIPLLVIEGPGLKEPMTLDWYTPQQVLQAIERAGAGRGLADAVDVPPP